MDRGREAGDQGKRIHFHGDRTVPERPLQLDGDEPLLGQGDVLGGNGRSEHVLEEVGSPEVVLGAGAGMGSPRPANTWMHEIEARTASHRAGRAARSALPSSATARLGAYGSRAKPAGFAGRAASREGLGTLRGFPSRVDGSAAMDGICRRLACRAQCRFASSRAASDASAATAGS